MTQPRPSSQPPPPPGRPSLRAVRQSKPSPSAPPAPVPSTRPTIRCLRCDRTAPPSEVDERVCADCPRPWILCHHCGRGRIASPLDERVCEECLPEPEVQRARAVEAAIRLRRAVAWAQGPVPVTTTAVPPDDRHLWARLGHRFRPHLFELGEREAYCGRVTLSQPAVRESVEPVAEAVEPCRACWRSYWKARSSRP